MSAPRTTSSSEIFPDGLPTPRRWLAVTVLWLGMAMSVLDAAIANIALPTLSQALRIEAATSIWIVNAYQLAIVACLLPFAALGERFGYRRIYLGGLALFTVASLACAASQGLASLVAARVVQGVGAAGIMSVNAALVRAIYPQARLGRGIGLNAVVISVSAAVGPTVASAILAVADWRWLFAINLPIGLLALALGPRTLPATEQAERPFDILAALLNAAAFCLFILGAETLADGATAVGAGQIAVGLAAAALLVRRELDRPFPLVPLDLLRIPAFRLSALTSFVSFTAQMLALLALPFHLHETLGREAVETGLLMTPWPLAVGLAAPIAGRLADRYPPGLLGGVGLALFAAGLLLLAGLAGTASDLDVVWRMVVCGVGFGLFQSPNNRALIGAAPRQRSGAAGGVLASARVMGQTTGAVCLAVLFHTFDARTATHHALIMAGVAAVAAAVVSVIRLAPYATKGG